MKIYFLTGILCDESEVIKNSKAGIQSAANVLQKKYLEGFEMLQQVESLDIINLSYIGSYPKYYKKIRFVTKEKVVKNSKTKIYDLNFFNLAGGGNFSRFWCSFLKSYEVLKSCDRDDNGLYFVYAMHLPFLLTAFFLKKINSEVKFYVIVPDLPEFMANRKGVVALIYNFFAKISYFLVNQLDGVVVLTEQMQNKFSNNLKKIVIEGISSNNDFDKINDKDLAEEKFFFYSGTLDNRYGLKDLIDSYSEVSQEYNIKLYICGEGPDKNTIIQGAKNNPNIKYLGILPRDEVLALQKKAILLINPRNDKNEFTKYSFPSKVLEYMSSGTPVLMYKLSGIPVEYFQYVYTIEDNVNSFTEMLIKISNLDSETLSEKGKLAKKFVEDYKNPTAQVAKILHDLG